MTDKQPDTLPAAMLTAQRAFKQPGKTGKNTSQGWPFLEVGAVLTAAADAFHAGGLVATFTEQGTFDQLLVNVVLTVQHPPTEAAVNHVCRWPVDRPGNQGRRAAISYAQKQLLIGLFLIGDADPEQDAEPAPAPQKKVRAPHAKITETQRTALTGMFRQHRMTDPEEQRAYITAIVGPHDGPLTRQQASKVIDRLTRNEPAPDPPSATDVADAPAPDSDVAVRDEPGLPMDLPGTDR